MACFEDVFCTGNFCIAWILGISFVSVSGYARRRRIQRDGLGDQVQGFRIETRSIYSSCSIDNFEQTRNHTRLPYIRTSLRASYGSPYTLNSVYFRV